MPVPAGRLRVGSDRHYPEERPVREVEVSAFTIDVYPVTNGEFATFVQATAYVTVAERPLDASQFPGVARSKLKQGALVFTPAKRPGSGLRRQDCWTYVPGAHWRRPDGKTNVFAGRLDHPVVCVAYEDAAAYAAWAGKTLPTEAQWEYAARGGLVDAEFAWGDEFAPGGRRMANTWDGDAFPYDPNLKRSLRTTAVGRFPANGHGLHDMIGNVWEWTRDWYVEGAAGPLKNGCCGQPPEASYDPALPGTRIPRRVLKGGSFLCAPHDCARYRPAARQPQMTDSASVHIGFRCVGKSARPEGGGHEQA